ncbi:MAG: hypothetical protein M1569_01430 [Candidatus Marsarchaeota archaeon]|nr:hypothetical protein [Candidatus Marsarchaeota archaeon]
MKRKEMPKSIIYIKLKSLDDLCRYASNFDYTNSCIMSIKSGGGLRLFAIGESVCDSSIAYYVNIERQEHMISYTYPMPGESENSHFLESPSLQQHYYMGIINISSAGFREAKALKGKEPAIVRLEAPIDLIIAAIKRGVSSESIPQIYAFDCKGKLIMCCFDVIEELADDNHIMYYTVADSTGSSNFVRYKYNENKIDFTDYMGEHSYMYAKIINLAEPFPFFKMPN